MAGLSRREFQKSLLHSFMYTSLFQLLCSCRAFAKVAAPTAEKWVLGANDLALAVRRLQISPRQWQEDMEKHLAKMDLADFFRYIDFDLLAQRTQLPDRGEAFEKFDFGKEPGAPDQFAFYKNLAGFKKGRSIPPHGHDNLVSCFIVLNGELRGRHFDRLRDEGDESVLKATIDKTFTKGQYSTVSDTKNNVHWFTALTDRAFIFDLGIAWIDPHWRYSGLTKAQLSKWDLDARSEISTRSGRIYFDVDKEVARGTTFRTSRLGHLDAYKKFG